MKKTIFILLFKSACLSLFSQANIVPNGSFEEVTGDYPASTTGTGADYYSSDFHLNRNEEYWAAIPGWTNFLKTPGCVWGVCSADVYPNGVEPGFSSHWGDKYGHCRPGEYLLNSISSYMQTSHTYYVEFYVHTGAALNANNSVGIRFFKNRPRICLIGNQRPNQPDGVAHLTVNQNIPVGEWVRCHFIYRPTENWEWFTLGDFANEQDDRAYTRWDDIKILDLGEGLCPYQWIWENTTFDDEHYIYQASNLIYAGYDFDNAGVAGPVVIKANSDIIFRSGDAIVLDTGFITEPGSYFETEIAGCETNPCPWPATLAGNYFFCDSLPHSIGLSSPETGLFFTWTPGDYLDHDTAANPLFAAPAGVGQIIYQVTQTSVCGGFFNLSSTFPWYSGDPSILSQVTVGWDSDPSPNPSITLSNINTGNYHFSFDAAYSEHTEKICISFLESGTDQVIGPYCLNRFDDFDCCSLSFNYENLPHDLLTQLSSCYDYQVIVSAKNFCFDTTAADTFAWDRVNTLSLLSVPNIITLRNPINGYSNGLNDEFCIEVEGADNYEITVSSTSNIVNQSSGRIVYNPQCIWDGQCHYLPNCTGLDLATGSYAVIVEVSNDCGQSDDYNGYVVIAYDEPPGMVILPDNEAQANAVGTQMSATSTAGQKETVNSIPVTVYPNPANDQVTVLLPPHSSPAIIRLQNSIGQQLSTYSTTAERIDMNVSMLEQGLYLLEVEQEGAREIFRLVISR